MTPVSARLAPLSPRDQLVEALALRLQLLDDAARSRVFRVVSGVAPVPTVAHHHPVAAVTAHRAPTEDPAADDHAHHHQRADQQQQQYRYPYRPFHLCAPSWPALAVPCSRFLAPTCSRSRT